MGNSLNISILIPLLPMVAALFVFVLLASFNRTINRLTKPVSAIIALSLLISCFISSFYYFKKIEGELFLSDFLTLFEGTNLVMHLNLVSEKLIIFFSLIMIIIIGVLFYKLPRKTGHVLLMVGLGLISSWVMLAILWLDFSALA